MKTTGVWQIKENQSFENGAPGEIRTPDLQLRRLPLYPAELRAHTDGSSLHAELWPINWWIERRRQLLVAP
jgi:hypothetical protein